MGSEMCIRDSPGTAYAGLVVHLDLATSSFLLTYGMQADAGGTAHGALPIPSQPTLGGLTVYAQSFWPWPGGFPCSPTPLGLSSSRALAVTLQPSP